MKLFIFIGAFSVCFFSFSQHKIEGKNLELTEDLIKLQSQLVDNFELKSTYRIQLYSGNLEGANKVKNAYRALGLDYVGFVHYEAPNYKVWVGNFASKLDADRAFLALKKNYPNSLVFKPGR